MRLRKCIPLLVLAVLFVAAGSTPNPAVAAETRKVPTKLTLNSVAEYPYGPGARDWRLWGRMRSTVPACLTETRRVSAYRGGRKIGSGLANVKVWGADTTRVKAGQRVRIKVAFRKVRHKGKPVTCLAASKTFRIKRVDPPSSGYAAPLRAGISASDSPLHNEGHDFGTLPIGGKSKTLSHTLIVNRGTEPIELLDFSFAGRGSSQMWLVTDGCSGELAAGDSCRIGVEISPGEKPGPVRAHLRISTPEGEITVQGPGFWAKVIGPTITRLRVPNLPASGRVLLAKVKCPMACKISVAPAAVRFGDHSYGIDWLRPRRLKAGAQAKVGLRLDRQRRAQLRRRGKGFLLFGVCATPLRASASTCWSPKLIRIRG